jgi:hypothetical protein
MFARIPRLVVIAAAVFFTLTIASSADAACSLKCVACQKACYATYISRKSFGTDMAIFKKQYRQCMKSCQTK